MPVLKANAYGHGLVEVAQLMVTLGADYLGAAFPEEGLALPGGYPHADPGAGGSLAASRSRGSSRTTL